MRPLRYSINVALDGCCDHRAIPRGGRRRGRERGLIGCNPGWNPTRTIDAAKKYVVSSTLDQVDWNAELVHGDLGQAVRQLKRESGKGLFVAGVKLALALTERGLRYEPSRSFEPVALGDS